MWTLGSLPGRGTETTGLSFVTVTGWPIDVTVLDKMARGRFAVLAPGRAMHATQNRQPLASCLHEQVHDKMSSSPQGLHEKTTLGVQKS